MASPSARARFGPIARTTARELAAAALRLSGAPAVVRRIATRQRATIIMYHDPKPATLERHLAYLSKRFQFITLDRLVDALHEQSWEGLPARSLVVTIDDGFRGNRELGEVFRSYNCRPTVFICTGIVGTRRKFWFALGDHRQLKALPQRERLQRLRDQLGFEPTREYADEAPQALSREDLAEMRSWADLQAHTRFHPILTTCDDAECEDEIVRSREETAALSGAECRHFSFPNGDYTERELALVRRAGYRSARTTDYGWNGPGTDPYRLRVAGVTDDASVNMLAVQLSCLVAYARCALRGRFDGTVPKNRLE